MKVLFAAGGTGGHLYPAFAIAEMLRARGDEVLFVGTRDRLEARLVPAAGYPLRTISAHPLARRASLDVFVTGVRNLAGIVQSLRILSRERPDFVVATGGYVCVPVAIAARIHRRLRGRRMPIALLEPNAHPGLANRVLEPLADEVWRAHTTGIPVRSALLRLPRKEEAKTRLGLAPEMQTLLVIGGSQGARSMNDAVVALILDGALPVGWQVLHLTGERDYERVRAAVGERELVRPYLEDLSDAYAAADLVLARAGASTLAELAAMRLPSILVPYPHAAEAHQAANAAAAAASGAAVVIDDERLGAALRTVLADVGSADRLGAMASSATRGDHDATSAVVARIDALSSRT